MNNENFVKLKKIIGEYLSEDAEIKEDVVNDNVDFGFIFEHPTGIDISGNPVGRPFTIIKPKDKNFININSSVMYSEEFAKKLEDPTQNIKNSFFRTLKSIFLGRNLLYSFNIKKRLYSIVDRIYLDNNGLFITKNDFYLRLRKVLNAQILSTFVITDMTANSTNSDGSTASNDDGSLYM